jgi:hypothetical protein
VGDYRIDRIDQTGTIEGVAEGVINPGEQIVLAVADILTARGGLKVAATEPLVAALVIDNGNTRAISTGGATGSRWVVPVTAQTGQAQTIIWILNTAGGPATVALTPLTGAADVTSVDLPAGAVGEIPLPDLAGGGILVESDQQIVVAFGVVAGEAIGYGMATVIG